MKNNHRQTCVAYYRLSRDMADSEKRESESITNQRMIIQKFCENNNIRILREFTDDGFSGGNFLRPGFQNMLRFLDTTTVDLVITKDLSRLGRDMQEASYYAEQYFPEKKIRFMTVQDNFDSASDNMFAPIQFAINEMYLRDGSKKIKETLKAKREEGQYCACPPYGYKKDRVENRLIVDDEAARVVKMIFEQALSGKSARQISAYLNECCIDPPLKYRVLHGGNFTPEGASKASDTWWPKTVKAILDNEVYTGKTILGKTKKISVKSKLKVRVDPEAWAIHEDTHPALVSKEDFDIVRRLIKARRRVTVDAANVRTSIFSGIAFCAECGRPLVTCGTVYKGEKMKYWYLSCTANHRIPQVPICKTRIKYATLLDVVKRDLNSMIKLSDHEIDELVYKAIDREQANSGAQNNLEILESARKRLLEIDGIIEKLYVDNSAGKIDSGRLDRITAKLQNESNKLEQKVDDLEKEINSKNDIKDRKNRYKKFFELIEKMSEIDSLDREILVSLVDRIEVNAKVFEKENGRDNGKTPFSQTIKVYYRFIGQL